MSYRKRHLWSRRLAVGLAFAAVIFAGRVSAAAAEFDDGVDASVYVSGWLGSAETESGAPLGAGIPYGDDRVMPEEELRVIPYLSHGILTPEDAKAASARPLVSRGKARRRPDGDAIAIKNVLQSRSRLTNEQIAFVRAVVGAPLRVPVTAESSGDRFTTESALGHEQSRIEHALEAQAQGGLSGHMVEVAQAVIRAERSPDRLTGAAADSGRTSGGQEQGQSSERLTPLHMGTDFPE